MSNDPRILELLQEILETGRSPEEVCANDLELLLEVRRRFRKVRNIELQLEDLFPPSRIGPDLRSPKLAKPDGELPEIPGYKLQAILGHGGMGVVYKALHLKLNRPVAIKMLLSGAYASASERARFMREAEAVARLTHANVVQVHDIGDLDGRPYFTMEFVEGGTLAEHLGGVPKPALQAAASIATLAEAVQAAHDAGGRPSRSQAWKHPSDDRRRSQDHRLWPGAAQ
jgi:serine/threonine-protein kinase